VDFLVTLFIVIHEWAGRKAYWLKLYPLWMETCDNTSKQHSSGTRGPGTGQTHDSSFACHRGGAGPLRDPSARHTSGRARNDPPWPRSERPARHSARPDRRRASRCRQSSRTAHRDVLRATLPRGVPTKLS